MSHFVVVVAGDVESQLAPYDEELQVAPYWQVEVETPATHWAYRSMLDEGLVTDSPTLEEYLAALRTKYPDAHGPLRIADGKIEEQSTYNPKSRWDWYAIGGRWDGYFTRRSIDGAPRSEVNVIAAGEIGWAHEHERLALKAEDEFRTLDAALRDVDLDYKSWGEMLTFMGCPEAPTDAAREAYWAQPAIAAARQALPTLIWDLEKPINAYKQGRTAFIQNEKRRAFIPRAFVIDGEWHERAKMGWFGLDVTEPMSDEDWHNHVHERLYSVKPETILTAVDCHI